MLRCYGERCDSVINQLRVTGVCVAQQPMIYKIYQAQADLMLSRSSVRQAWRRRGSSAWTWASSPRLPCGTWRRVQYAGGRRADASAGRITGSDRQDGQRCRCGRRGIQRFETPFATLLRFRKNTAVVQPRVLVVAPMSGHFATLLRGTVAVLLPDHDVYITDWKNARDIAAVRWCLRFRRVCRSPDPVHGGDGRGKPYAGGLPASGCRARRHRHHGRDAATAHSRAA